MQEENAGEKNKESFREWSNTQRSEDAYQQFLAEKKAEKEKAIQEKVDKGVAVYKDGVLYNPDMTVLLECCDNEKTSFIVPDTVRVIELNAFSYRSSLKRNYF